MEFNEKLQELRKQKGLTQEELAEKLYVSRTAVSKWEAGRGYPNLDSLKALAHVFSVTVDQLLSPTEALSIAEADTKRCATHARDLMFGLLDICLCMLLFLPFFAERADGGVQGVSLLACGSLQPYVKVALLSAVALVSMTGILTLALQGYSFVPWIKSKTALSLSLGSLATVLFMISSQPYAAVFSFVLLAAKAFMLIKRS